MNDSPSGTGAASSTRSGRLVEFLLGLRTSELPAEVVREARIRLLDGLGCGVYGAVMPWGKIAAATVYYISPTGSASNSGTSSSSPWSLSKAMSSLVAGDVCRVLPGAYTGDVVPVNHGTPYSLASRSGIAGDSDATFAIGSATQARFAKSWPAHQYFL